MAEWQTRTVEGRMGNTVLVQVQSAAPTSDNPNQIFRVRDWFGLFVFFEKFAHTRFRNDADKRTKSEMRVVWTNSEIPKINFLVNPTIIKF